MGFVYNHGKAFSRQRADLIHDHGKLLQRGDDDGLAIFKRLLQLVGGRIDIFDHAEGLLELLYRLLELLIEHAAVGNDDDGIEYPLILYVMEDRELVSQPGDGIALATARAVFDQVTLSRPFCPRVRYQAAHGIELVVTREDQALLARLFPFVIVFLDLLNELLDKVEHAGSRPDTIPLANAEKPDDKEREKQAKEEQTGEGPPRGEDRCH